MVLVLINGQMVENTQGIGEIIKCMVLDFSNGLMADAMKGNILMIKKRVKELLNGIF